MVLHPPFAISARLLPCLRIEDCTISVQLQPQRDDENRCCYMMYFDFDGGDEVTDGPIRSGCEAKVNHQEAFATLMSFLGAAAESYRYTMQGQYSDNSDLFPPKVMEWAYQNQNDIDSLAFELEETKNLIEE